MVLAKCRIGLTHSVDNRLARTAGEDRLRNQLIPAKGIGFVCLPEAPNLLNMTAVQDDLHFDRAWYGSNCAS